jgi:hypothetical protein
MDLFWFAIFARRSLREEIWEGIFATLESNLPVVSFCIADPVRAYSNRRRRISRASIDESIEPEPRDGEGDVFLNRKSRRNRNRVLCS